MRQFLESNDTISDTDTKFLEGYIAGKQNFVEELDTHLAELSAAQKALTTFRSTITSDIAQRKKALHPIRRFPPEVLSEIFLQCIDENGMGSEVDRFLHKTSFRPKSSLDPSQCPWTLSQVCRRWRAVSLAFCSLWSNIYLYIRDKKPRKCIDMLILQLHRSGTHPLKVAFTAPHSMKDFPPIIDVLISSCRRWKTLFLSENCMSQIAQIEGSLPILSALYIVPVSSSSITIDPFAFRDMPSLHTIGGDISILQCCNLPWTQIKSVIYPCVQAARERKIFLFWNVSICLLSIGEYTFS